MRNKHIRNSEFEIRNSFFIESQRCRQFRAQININNLFASEHFLTVLRHKNSA